MRLNFLLAEVLAHCASHRAGEAFVPRRRRAHGGPRAASCAVLLGLVRAAQAPMRCGARRTGRRLRRSLPTVLLGRDYPFETSTDGIRGLEEYG
jgi:hypothetical protein